MVNQSEQLEIGGCRGVERQIVIGAVHDAEQFYLANITE